MRKILISAATLFVLAVAQTEEHIKLEQQKKCKNDAECKPKKCLRGMCANPTFADLFFDAEISEQSQTESISLESGI